MSDAASRRDRMSVRVFPSNAAQDAADAAYWLALPEGERVLEVWKLSEAQWRQRGEEHEPGLSRSITRVRRP